MTALNDEAESIREEIILALAKKRQDEYSRGKFFDVLVDPGIWDAPKEGLPIRHRRRRLTIREKIRDIFFGRVRRLELHKHLIEAAARRGYTRSS